MDSNCVLVGDCMEVMKGIPSESFDLVTVDPPFNIDFEYDQYKDRLSYDQYMHWTLNWGLECRRLLKPNGSLWLMIGDAFASDLDILFRRHMGFHRRSWVVWYYTFGVNCKNKFTPSHAHLFHYVMDKNDFTFNSQAIKVKSAREAVYGDKRAKSGGRLPDDTWHLRPQETPEEFGPDRDTWYIPRLCGTHKERVGHPCQMPLALCERIIRVSSNPGDLVFDPMCGSGTFLVASKKLERRYVGIELSDEYAKVSRERLAATAPLVPVCKGCDGSGLVHVSFEDTPYVCSEPGCKGKVA